MNRVGRAAITGGGLALAVVAAVTVGALTANDEEIGLVLAVAVAVAGLLAIDPLLLPVAAFPAVLLVQRTPGGSGGGSLSLSDVVLVLAVLVALPQVRWGRATALGRALVPPAAYLGLVAVTIAVHPNSHDTLEWGHRLEMVVGSLVVGWAVGAHGRGRQAVGAFLLGCDVLAVLALKAAVSSHFQPGQFGYYQKNYIGALMWMAVIVAHLRPAWLGLPHRFTLVTKYLCAVALLATQSKQSIIALLFAALLAAALDVEVRRRSRLLISVLVPMLIAAYFMFASETKVASKFNTLGARETNLSADIKVWLLDPIFGQGLRWYYLPKFSNYIQPPNIFVEALADAGIIGLFALLVLLIGSARASLKLPRPLVTLGIVLLLGRAVEAIFDVYWVSTPTTLPWMVIGLALGVWDAGLWLPAYSWSSVQRLPREAAKFRRLPVKLT